MNKKLVLWMIPLALITISFTYHNTTKVSLPCYSENTAFNQGENLTYKVFYNLGFLWIPAGEVNFSVKENMDSYEIRALGKTYKSYESIFKVNDYFYSKVDKNTMLPTNFVRIVEEGNYKLYDSITFQQDKNIAYSYQGKTKNTTSIQTHKYDGCMQDLVSNLYKLRTTDLSGLNKGDKLETKILFDKEIFPVSITFEGKEKKKIKDLGTFKTIRINPQVIVGNVFKKDNKMVIWVSDDSNKVPLLIESPIAVGSVKMVLKEHKGLKYPFSSKV